MTLYNRDAETIVQSIAVCAGSGASVLAGVKADVYVTGEMSHHEVLDAMNNGSTVILCEHTNTERGFLAHWAHVVHASLDSRVAVFVSGYDSDPLRIV